MSVVLSQVSPNDLLLSGPCQTSLKFRRIKNKLIDNSLEELRFTSLVSLARTWREVEVETRDQCFRWDCAWSESLDG